MSLSTTESGWHWGHVTRITRHRQQKHGGGSKRARNQYYYSFDVLFDDGHLRQRVPDLEIVSQAFYLQDHVGVKEEEEADTEVEEENDDGGKDETAIIGTSEARQEANKNLEYPAICTIGDDTIRLHGRVMALWEETNEWHWGKVTRITLHRNSDANIKKRTKRTKKRQTAIYYTFDVKFDDGDARLEIPDDEIISQAFYLKENGGNETTDDEAETETDDQAQVKEEQNHDDVLQARRKRARTRARKTTTSSKNAKPRTTKKSDAAQSIATIQPMPLADIPCAVRVKSELCHAHDNDTEYGISLAQRQERQRQRQIMNRIADGSPRHVFRRGCHQQSLSTVFGGSATDHIPSVKSPRPRNGGKRHFIRSGEFYVAGNADWNRWTPFFPGDQGFVEKHVADKAGRNGQLVFHMFLSCSTRRQDAHYHGRNARGKYLYLGRYRIKTDETGSMVFTQMFQNLSWDGQCAMAELYSRDKGYKWMLIGARGFLPDLVLLDNGRYDAKEEYYDMARVKADERQENTWNTLTPRRQQILAWVEMLLAIQYSIEVVPVEFVDYDEDLYDALVAAGAHNGQVSLVENDLGPF